jgi:hypothetical protein
MPIFYNRPEPVSQLQFYYKRYYRPNGLKSNFSLAIIKNFSKLGLYKSGLCLKLEVVDNILSSLGISLRR